jgi:integrase
MEVLMGERNRTGVRRVRRGGKSVLVLDFRYTDTTGKQARYRRDAQVQTAAGANAEAQRRMVRAVRSGNPYDEPASSAPTLREFVETDFTDYAATQRRTGRWKPGTADTYRGRLPAVVEHYGSRRLDQITAADHLAFARKHPSRSSAAIVRVVLLAAKALGVVETVPPLPEQAKRGKTCIDAPTHEEVLSAFEHATGWVRVAIGLGGWAGLRACEFRALRVGDVDFTGDRIFVRHSFSGREVSTPKSRNERWVPIAPQLRPALREACRDKLPGAYVLTTRLGGPPCHKSVWEQFQLVLTRAGLPRRRVHALRHYFCSQLVRGGASVEAVRVLAGHSTLAMTQRYVHAQGDDLRAAIARLPGN